jgi:predicted N-acetyltransferase YhbS
VDPAAQGQGLGTALVATGLALAQADGIGAFLSTGTARNVDIYARSGFRVVEEADAPDGGPKIYFMRWDP